MDAVELMKLKNELGSKIGNELKAKIDEINDLKLKLKYRERELYYDAACTLLPLFKKKFIGKRVNITRGTYEEYSGVLMLEFYLAEERKIDNYGHFLEYVCQDTEGNKIYHSLGFHQKIRLCED